jgi:hypothetical protein
MALMYGSAGAPNRSPQGSSRAQLGGEEVRGPSSAAVSAGVADTAAVSAGAADSAAASAGAADSSAVQAVMAPPVPVVQNLR